MVCPSLGGKLNYLPWWEITKDLRIGHQTLALRMAIAKGSLIYLPTSPDIFPCDQILRGLEISLVEISRAELILPPYSPTPTVAATELVHLPVVRDCGGDHPLQHSVNEGPLNDTAYMYVT